MSSVGDGASSIEVIKEYIKEKSDSFLDYITSMGNPKNNNKKSLCLDIGWTFSQGKPSGIYKLTLNGKDYGGQFSNGKIEIIKQLDKVTGSGELAIRLMDSNGNVTGPSYLSEIELDLPPVQTPEGLARRLTNLGFYAGTDGKFNARMQWAVRAFKRVHMNGCQRNRTEPENNDITQAFLSAVHVDYGTCNEDSIPAAGLSFREVAGDSEYCGMFGSRTYCRNSFQTRGALDDRDPKPDQAGIWEGTALTTVKDGKTVATVENEPIAGNFKIYLRAFDPSKKESEIRNRINLPQPIHMAQFVLFELGYWLVDGEKDSWVEVDGTWTRVSFVPDGIFGRYTQWAVREFQCHAKFPKAAKEDVASTEQRYLPRIFSGTQNNPPKLTGMARYPDEGKVSGALNEATRKAMQAWADGVLRCPVIVYASMDNSKNAIVKGSNLTKLVRENLWLYNDHAETAPRMYAIDYSGYYTISERYRGQVSYGGYTFPKPIVVGTYQITSYGSGAVSNPPRHTWESQDVEITPNNLIGKGGINGAGLTEKELSTFKVVRTASKFECSAYFDCFNAWDDVTISFGPCHWTLASLKNATQQRELPAFLAYVKHAYPETYQTFFGNFGLSPKRVWTSNPNNRPGKDEDSKKVIKCGGAAYNDNITIQTEKDNVILCGISGTASENSYCKGWHWFYRFQMACRISKYLHKAMWDFTRFRIRDIREHTLVLTIAEKDKPVQKEEITIGDYITSEKGVAMLLRWHIWRPAHICNQPIAKYDKDGKYIGREDNNYIFGLLSEQIKAYSEAEPLNDEQKQEREDAILLKLKDASLTIKDKNGNISFTGVRDIYNLDNVPQKRSDVDEVYLLDLGFNEELCSEYGSFKFQLPEPSPKKR